MSSRIALTKMHGARNDFVVVDGRTQSLGGLSEFAKFACDRRDGIGADGVIVIESSSAGGLAMRTVNADGSEAEMCGNGVRCAARWLDEAGEGDRVVFQTPGGTVRTEIVARDPAYLVRVIMPVPRLIARFVEGLSDAAIVDVGNPHVVVFGAGEDVGVESLGPQLQNDPRWPDGVNVHAAIVEDEHRVRVRHWERGAGATQACGTGAVAAAFAAIERGAASSPVFVHVPGGTLVVEWDGREAVLVGPAVRVFDTAVTV
ncbi:MAG: diaminopimelate epimerase [Candidatus Tumulicola sp.]